MTYSVIGMLAIFVHVIVNFDIIRGKDRVKIPSERDYFLFLISVISYHVTDVLWGILYEHKLTSLVYADTVVYFLLMAFSVMTWMRYALRYMGGKDFFGKIFYRVGQGFFLFQIVTLIVNFFKPIIFHFDENGVYYADVVRYATFLVQMLMYLITSFYSLFSMIKSSGTVKRRHLTIGAFGITMILAITAQLFFPLYPFYSIGYLLGCCLIHTFVMEDEKEEYARELSEAFEREKKQHQELSKAKHLVFTDPLTGLRSKHAYVDAEERLDYRMSTDPDLKFAIAVFDLNDLKSTNDTQGHEIGDEHIVAAGNLICDTFKNSPVYRIGGDEFVSILEGKDYEQRAVLMEEFNARAEKNAACGKVVVSSGISEYKAGEDKTFKKVFSRADKNMYLRKRILKECKVEK